MTKLKLIQDHDEELVDLSGKEPRYWRSFEHKAQTELAREAAENEFPFGSALTPDEGGGGFQRRDALKLMGASMALAGLGSACVRRPEEQILPYNKQPEEVIPGVANYYATAYPGPNGAVGILAESHEGRPTKIEGNPDHPASGGAADMHMQASVLELYDPDRSRQPMNAGAKSSWGMWDTDGALRLQKDWGKSGGQGVAFLTDGSGGPSFDHVMAEAKKKYPKAQWFHYEPLRADNTAMGAEMVFGNGTRVHYDLSKADVVLSLDSNFLAEGPDHLRLARGFAAGRGFDRVQSAKDAAKMNRLYVVEGVFSTTGSNADNRLRVASSEVSGFAKALTAELMGKNGVALPGEYGAASALVGALKTSFKATNAKFIPALAKDLAKNKGKAVILVGERQPAAVHALAHLLNGALGAFDNGIASITRGLAPRAHGAMPIPTTSMSDAPLEGEPAVSTSDGSGEIVPAPAPSAPSLPAYESCAASMKKLVDGLNKGGVQHLVVLGPNPAYTAAAHGYADAVKKAKTVIHLGLYADETAQGATWHLPMAHFLETWGDATSWDGTLTVQQPLVQPLHGGRSAAEVLSQLIGIKDWQGRTLVEGTWTKSHGISASEWRKLLHRGATKSAHRETVTVAQTRAADGAGNTGKALGALKDAAPAEGNLEAVFVHSNVLDGRHGNLGWKQELPDPMTKLCWDNAIVVAPKLAKKMGLSAQMKANVYQANVLTVTANGKSADVPVFVLPGLNEHTVQLALGYGREHGGSVAKGVGVDVGALLPADGSMFALGVTLKDTGKTIDLAGTQDHFSVEGEPIQDSETLSMGDRQLAVAMTAETYGKDATLAQSKANIMPGLLEKSSKQEKNKPLQPLQMAKLDVTKDEWHYDGQAWGMTIDLTACTGCNACVVACQSENNIPVVGRESVQFGREMHWLRIDRYFTGDVDNPQSVAQGVPCMQCENAPCEPVCPVAATVHDEEGLNSMVYNRCIGTRYCANNCPYKVRRFNYFDYTKSGNIWVEADEKARHKMLRMQRNPDVSVRYRGTMEKCTYCTQRIQEAKYAAKRRGEDHRNLPDGVAQPACAQTCPSQAIAFGNINGKNSDGSPYEVVRRKVSDRNYEMLSMLNVRPRTTYLAKIRNPNPEAV
jgi:molybdopterin-containing oxidoreductase family iron-sulfur binding subunit